MISYELTKYFAVCAGPGGDGTSGGRVSGTGEWWSDIPLFGKLYDWIVGALSAAKDATLELNNAKDIVLNSFEWLPPAIIATVGTAVGVIVIMKLFKR